MKRPNFSTFKLGNIGLHPRSLQFQITFTVLSLLTLSFTISNSILFSAGIRTLEIKVQAQLEAESNYLAFAVERWQEEVRKSLELIAYAPALRRDDRSRFKNVLATADKVYPHRVWRIWDRYGNLLANTGSKASSYPKAKEILSRRYFQEALRGKLSFTVLDSMIERTGCLVAATPYYTYLNAKQSLINSNPSGVVSFCLRLTDLGKDFGLNRLESIDPEITGGAAQSHSNLINPEKNIYHGRAFFLINSSGHIVFPSTSELNHVSMLSTKEILSGPWGPFIKLSHSSKPKDFLQISLRGVDYFAFVRKIPGGEWTSVSIIDKQLAFSLLYARLREVVFLQALTLILITWATFLACKRIATPLHMAGQALRDIRNGNFILHLPPPRRDEMGDLLEDISQTAAHIQQLIVSQTQLAVTARQIETARSIHQDFLIKEMPTSNLYDLAVFTDPALEVGADWYDVLVINNTTIVVIADVCDKGVGSALYMSVFRSLLRYSLQRFSLDTTQDSCKILSSVATLVNDYMAENHADSVMFATVFIGAYKASNQSFSYLTAGHEQPLLLSSTGLIKLDVTGPAIGIFAGAKFQTKTIRMLPGDLLFAYTDGLLDARSSQGTSWGLHSLEKLLLNASRSSLSAQSMISTVVEQVRLHIDSAESFDDLTLLALHIPPTPYPI
ncbi:MAG: SpoIIE family protein phosphatase [Cyanobacteria bacterium]|nr:SpoIIE family protein phosphatase [Cyanobacteriota bacterium]